jgi:hypothetical protein
MDRVIGGEAQYVPGFGRLRSAKWAETAAWPNVSDRPFTVFFVDDVRRAK